MSDPTPNPPQPAPISESELLDWIEGRLPRIECDRLAAASGRAGLRSRIEEMQANRRVLARLPELEAPAGLAERVLAALERDTLIGLSDGAPLSDSLPISTIPARHRRNRWWSHGRAQFAMAAGLALIAGGAAWWGVLLARSPDPVIVAGDLAIHQENPGEAPLAMGTDEASVDAGTARSTDLVAPAERSTTALARARDESSFFAADSTAGQVVTDDARALALAREGKLVMRVVASNTRALPQITSVATAPSTLRDWRLSDAVPAATVAMVMPKNVPFGLSAGEPILASSEAVSLLGPRAMFTWSAAFAVDRASKVRGTYIAELPGKRSVLTAVRSLFADKLDASVVLEELAEPIPASGAVDPGAALWWTRPSSAWVPSVHIPIVVEER